jgi:transcriptional regulator with XRE-family HTH domain
MKVTNGLYLKARRERAGLSQRAFGARLGLSSPYLSDIETNRRVPSRGVIAEYLALKKACPVFRPDHNGECLNCDEWADAHTNDAVRAGEAKLAGARRPRRTPRPRS